MYINTLSPVLDEMLVQEHKNDILHLEITDAVMFKEFFAESVIHMLLQKKKMLVIAPDRMDASIPSKILTNYNLAHYSVHYAPATASNPILTNRIRTLSDLKEIPLLRQEFNHSLLKYKEINHKIHDALLGITKKSVKSPSFKEMLLSIKPRPKVAISESVIEAISDVHINPEMISRIKKLQGDYKNSYPFMDATSRMTDACLEDTSALQFAQTELSELHTGLCNSLVTLEQELYLMKRVIAYEVEEEIAKWSKTKEQLQSIFLDNELDNFPSSFEENGIPVIKQFSGCKYLKLNLEIIPEKGWGQVSQILNIVKAVMASAADSIDIYFEDYIRKLSPFNTQNELLDVAIQDGINFLIKINSSKYIRYSCKTQFLQVDAIIDELRTAGSASALCVKALCDKAYIKFCLDRKELCINDQVIQNLYQLEHENWAEIIEFYGSRSHLTLNYNSNMNLLEDWYSDLASAQQIVKHNSHKEIHNRWSHIRNQAIALIKNNHWEIYRNLFEGGDITLTIKELIEEIGSSIQSFFPLMVVKESELKDILKDPSLTFDTALFLDPKSVSITDVSLIREKNIELSIVTTHTVDLSDLKTNYSIVSNYCSDVRIQTKKELKHLVKTERYKLALALAGNLIPQIRAANIYKFGQKVIISTIDELLNKRIVKELGVPSKNILFEGTPEIENILETLIHYDDVTILIENNVLNDHNGISVAWQHSVLDQMKNCGLTIKNVFTYELYQNINDTITDICKSLKFEVQVEPKTTKTVLTV